MAWIGFSILEKQIEDKAVVGAASIIIAQSFMTAEDKETVHITSSKGEVEERGKKVYQLLYPLATKLSKN